MQEKLQHDDAVFHEMPLKCIDLVIARPPDSFGLQLQDANDQHILVMGAVEHTDVAVARNALVDVPELVVGEFLGRRLLEAGRLDARRVHKFQDVLDRPMLAADVHPLKENRHRVTRVGVEQS